LYLQDHRKNYGNRVKQVISKSIPKNHFSFLSERKIIEANSVVIKKTQNVSILWKVIVLAFPLIGSSLVWKVGDVEELLIGENPWVGSRIDFKLHENMIIFLHGKCIFN